MKFLKENTEKQEEFTYLELYKAYRNVKPRAQKENSESTRRLISVIEEPLNEIFKVENQLIED